MIQCWSKVAAITLAAFAGCAAAQGYPNKPIRLVVPFVAGGGTDLTARIIAQRLNDALGQPVVVDNRPGAGGVIGADLVAKAQPDGYTLLMGTPGSLTINPNLQPKMPYRLQDFAPVTLATLSPFVMVVHPSVPASSVKELVALAKAKPGVLNYGSAGNGSVAHLSAEQFKSLAGVQLTHVPYKGSAQSVTDLIGGQLQVMFENQPVVLPHIRSGKLRALGVGTARRSALLPDVPTVAEAGVPGYEASTAFGVLAPAKTPHDVIARLNRDIVAILQTPEVRERLAALGLDAVGSTPAQYAEHLKSELAQYGKAIKAAGIRAD